MQVTVQAVETGQTQPASWCLYASCRVGELAKMKTPGEASALEKMGGCCWAATQGSEGGDMKAAGCVLGTGDLRGQVVCARPGVLSSRLPQPLPVA